MFNITVLKMKDILRILIGIVLTILIVIIFSKNFHKETKDNEEKIVQKVKTGISSLSENSMIGCIEKVIPTVANINDEYKNISEEDDPKQDENILQVMLKTEIFSIEGIEVAEAKENKDNTNDKEKKETEENIEIEIEETGVTTQVITNNPISDGTNAQYGKVKIKNETSYTLTEDMLKPDITIENKNIVLFHTHSCESYTSSEKYSYTPTGTFRTTDLNYTVTRVGTELEQQLKSYNYNVIHNTDYHDYPAYNGSYTRSLATVESILQTNPSDIIIDVHRDAIGSRSDYAPTVKIGDTDEAAQIMFVIRNG